MSNSDEKQHVLLVEPFYGGSHKQLIDFLEASVSSCHGGIRVTKVTMTDKKWPWRLRTSALHLSEAIPEGETYSCLFVSSVLNLAELTSLRPELLSIRKVVYFHENQLVYPVQRHDDTDFQLGYNQIISCLVADQVYFNSSYNMESFISNIHGFMNTMPDYRPKNLQERICAKSSVLYFPIRVPVHRVQETVEENELEDIERVLHIVWPHRWEHDKNAEDFFEVLIRLKTDGFKFLLSCLGQSYTQVPDVFTSAKKELEEEIIHWGFRNNKQEYEQILRTADVVVSTAKHEFFGVAMLEAVCFGCYPVCPNRLVYPEIFPCVSFLYNTTQQLYKKLRNFSRFPTSARKHAAEIDISRFSEDALRSSYLRALGIPDE